MNKQCPECNRQYESTIFARHIRSCRIRKQKRIHLKCKYCSKEFIRSSNAKRHSVTCKAKNDYIEELEDKLNKATETSIKMCQENAHLSLKLNKALEKSADAIEKSAKANGKVMEMQLQLSDMKLDFTKKMSLKDIAYEKLLSQKNALTINNTYNSYQNLYAIHMTPWNLDPSNPTYKTCLKTDAANMKHSIKNIPALPLLDEFVNLDNYAQQQHSKPLQRIFSRVLKDHLTSPKPSYIILDSARQKGLFKEPNGVVKVDSNMDLLLNHQREIAKSITSHRCWYFKKGRKDFKDFQNMITTEGRNGALRIKSVETKSIDTHHLLTSFPKTLAS